MSLGLQASKPWLAALLMPPVPAFLLMAWGLWTRPRRPRTGLAATVLGMALVWLACTPAIGGWLTLTLTRPPPALDDAQRARLAGAPATAVLVLGAGRRAIAPEYGEADLTPMTAERLRYGAWLARQARLPLAYSGGLAPGVLPGPTEADVAQRIVRRDLGLTLRWAEDRSRDTDENARYSVRMLAADGIRTIVLVTHAYHQQRALAAFQRAIERQHATMQVIPAPLVVPGRKPPTQVGDWMPSIEGFAECWLALHEWIGWLAGA